VSISKIAGVLFVVVLVLVALVFATRRPAVEKNIDPAAATPPAIAPPAEEGAAEDGPGFLYGRITSNTGVIHEGRLRFGVGQEAFWGDYFNGVKKENPWSTQAPPERLPKERTSIELFGLKIANREHPSDLGRRFMARFGDVARVEARGRDVRVTLKSGTVFDLNRFDASDFDDGVRVWDARGVVDLDSLQIGAIEFLPTARLGAVPDRLYGTVRTKQGEFTGFVQWDRDECVGTDELNGRTDEGEVSLRFDTIRSIARRSDDGSLVTLLEGREMVLSGTNDVNRGNRGISVDDSRFGRVVVSWEVFERVDFSPGGSGPAYGEFPPGQPLRGSVTTRDGRRLAGRLVYDLDESETTETFDAPFQGVDYTIPFGLIASIVPPGGEDPDAPRARVVLHGGALLQPEPEGDLGKGNAGMLIFVEGAPRPEYVPWSDVGQVEFDHPTAMYPPLGLRHGD